MLNLNVSLGLTGCFWFWFAVELEIRRSGHTFYIGLVSVDNTRYTFFSQMGIFVSSGSKNGRSFLWGGGQLLLLFCTVTP